MTWVCTREPPTARLRLADSPSSRAILGGGWWPAPRGPVVELCGLVIALTAQRGGVIERITLQPATWYRHPCRIGVGGATVRLGWFTTPGGRAGDRHRPTGSLATVGTIRRRRSRLGNRRPPPSARSTTHSAGPDLNAPTGLDRRHGGRSGARYAAAPAASGYFSWYSPCSYLC
ncbi:DUF5994 family protein [Micromonospora globispora]|uniref:DUF5994 family protein n=1 Tax=Micromonospora globispora TaxID=1450148 RepID=UPI001C898C62